MTEIIISTLKQSLMITAFVLLMMVIIEYVNVQSKNKWAEKLRHSPLLQIVMAAFLGITPGCMGAFTVVSLYTHRLVGLAALVTVMIATSGDEAFVMFALFPGKALLIHGILFLVAIIAGFIVLQYSSQKKNNLDTQHGFTIHHHDYCKCFDRQIIIPQIKKITFERLAMLLSILVFILMLTTGVFGTQNWGWKRITFLAGSMFLLFVFITVPEHFLKEHLYNHIIKKHLLRILLWSWGAFIVLFFFQNYSIMTEMLGNNFYLVLLIAVMIGIIPESGPHLVFVTLFSEGLIPLSILLASSIAQDGHGMLPLLAESRKSFLKVKAINILVALIVGYVLMLMGI
ncbi:MAG: arsenic efflux protein [Prolixibacteraceae bacterium]|nr:arsenic efflux protein [Prolixibacteraceae bacterium]